MSFSGLFRLTIDDCGRCRTVRLRLGCASIGRGAGNIVRLDGRHVSRHHVRLQRRDGHFWAEDLGSANGIRINDRQVQGRARVRVGDVIQIGESRVRLEGSAPRKPGSDGEDDSPVLERTDQLFREEGAPLALRVTRSDSSVTPIFPRRPRSDLRARWRRRTGRLAGVCAGLFGIAVVLGGWQWQHHRSEATHPPVSTIVRLVGSEKPALNRHPGATRDPGRSDPTPYQKTTDDAVDGDAVQLVGGAPSLAVIQPLVTNPLAPSSGEAKADRSSGRQKEDTRAVSLRAERALAAGDLTRAEVLAAACVARTPQFALCHRTLGLVHATRGNSTLAARFLTRYVHLAPNAMDAELIRSRLEQYRNQP